MGITVVDSIMGSGKTSAIINYINDHRDDHFIVVTPFLSEVDRFKEKTKARFFDPINKGNGKLAALNGLLQSNCNIVTTHSLFLSIDEETERLMGEGNYTLILDEVLDVIVPYNTVCENPHKLMEKGDISFLINKGFITRDQFGNTAWEGTGDFEDYKFSEIERFARTGNLICVDDYIFFWQFSPKVFSLFSNVFVLTYMFDGTILKAYFDYYGMQYEKASAGFIDGRYQITAYADDTEIRHGFLPLVKICYDERLNKIGNCPSAMSKSWFLSASPKDFKQLKRHINSYLKYRTKAEARNVMWTSFKTDYNKIVGRGYTYVHCLSQEERRLKEREKSKLCCFVACNSRATNDFSDRTVLMYLINRYPDPNLVKLLAKKGVTLDRNQYALSEMIQWIWRSAVRNGKPINIYIPSKRMRKLLYEWLGGKGRLPGDYKPLRKSVQSD